MSLNKIKKFIKNNNFIYKIYISIYGNKKYAREKESARVLLQEHGMEYIELVENALTATHCKFFLNYGSLMGLMREGKFISWDNDIDYGIFINDTFSWKEFEHVMNRFNFKLARQFKYNGKITEQTYKWGILTIDFFGHYENENNSYEYIYFRKKKYIYESVFDSHVCILKMYKFSDVVRKLINGKLVTIPSEPEKYLASIYTENWRTPDPNWVSSNGPAWNEIPGAISKAEFFL